ncbi:MAG: hypothetical protein D6769_02630 [Methanobacteriota archaeon]|nr:MAG: hypothetical protein D6769_02630 [Euryarchaeota archaeon]
MKTDMHLPPSLKKYKRKMAVILPKDAGAIIAYADINKESIVVEIGGGTGFLTHYLAGIAKKVTTYEVREDAFKILSKNTSHYSNLTLKNEDGKFFSEREVDAVVVDVPNSHEFVERSHSALVKGGSFVAYIPSTEQLKDTYIAADSLFREIFSISLPYYDVIVRKKGTRPANFSLMHTAYLLFARK